MLQNNNNKMIILLLFVLNFSLDLVCGETVIVCDPRKVDFTCPVDKVLVFEWALYGRDSLATCIHRQRTKQTLCTMKSVIGIINSHCSRRKKCSIQPSRLIPTDLNCDTSRYLTAKFSCVSAADVDRIKESHNIIEEDADDAKIQQLKSQLAQLEEQKRNRLLKIVNTDRDENHNLNGDKNKLGETEMNLEQQKEVMEIPYPKDKQTDEGNQEAKVNSKDTKTTLVDLKNGAIVSEECVRESMILPENSYIVSYKQGMKMQIGCQEGYTMDDEDKGLFVCHENKWVGKFGLCLVQTCRVPETTEHGEVIFRRLTVGETADYICHKGYFLVGVSTVTCRNGGNWSGKPPKCQESGRRRLSIPGEILIAILMSGLFMLLKKSIPKLFARLHINFSIHRSESQPKIAD